MPKTTRCVKKNCISKTEIKCGLGITVVELTTKILPIPTRHMTHSLIVFRPCVFEAKS